MKSLADHYDKALPDSALITVPNGDLRLLADPDAAAFKAFAASHTADEIFDADVPAPAAVVPGMREALDEDHMQKISALIARLQSTMDQFGDTCVYIRRGGLSWGAVALNRRDDDKKHGVFDLQTQHDRDMSQRAEQVERLIASKNEWMERAAKAEAALAAPVPPADGAAVTALGTHGLFRLVNTALNKFNKTIPSDDAWTIANEIFDATFSPSGTGAVEPVATITDAQWERALNCAHEIMQRDVARHSMQGEGPLPSKKILDNAMQHAFGMLSLKAVALPPVRGLLEQCAKIAQQFELDMSNSQLDDRDIENIKRGASEASSAIERAILSLPVQSSEPARLSKEDFEAWCAASPDSADPKKFAREIVTEWLGMFDPPPQIDFQQSEFLQGAIAAALSSAPEATVSGWPQPFTTAPRDGSPILARCNDHSETFALRWDGEYWTCADANTSFGDGLFLPNGDWIPDLFNSKPSPQDVGREATIKECAKFVEQHQENIRETSNGSERYLSPRKTGNQMGIAYVTGILSLSRKGGER